MRKIPSSMATQHPDNANRYITIQQEPEEAIQGLTCQEKGGLGIEEIMIDFEGKLTPYHQTSQIALGLIGQGMIPGKTVAITPRIPNAKKEPVFRQLMSIMSLVETNVLSYQQTGVQAITETIVPMVETGIELSHLQERINSVIELGNKNYEIQFPLNSIKIIPLIESVPALVNVDKILDDYYQHEQNNGQPLEQLRIMLARSDSAMSYGMMASVLSVLMAIDKALKWGAANKVELAPILGCGALPFRGHFTAENLDRIYETYAGVKTYTIQSALRYDHGAEKTKAVVNCLKKNSDQHGQRNFAPADLAFMQECIGIFTKYYMETFVKTIDIVGLLSKYMPKNRDRLASTKSGLEYIREIANMQEIADLVENTELKKELLEINTNVKCSVPRAISFTAALYTLGLPPEFVGVGRGLQEVQKKYGEAGINKLIDIYPQLRADLTFASQYVNVKVAKGIIDESARAAYQEDYERACEILEIENASSDEKEKARYQMLLKSIRPIILHLIEKEDPGQDQEEEKILNDWIIKMATIRGSLG